MKILVVTKLNENKPIILITMTTIIEQLKASSNEKQQKNGVCVWHESSVAV